MDMLQIEVAQGKYKSAKEARNAGQIPMICYGKGLEPQQYTVEYQVFRKAFNKAGKSSIISLTMGGKDIQDVIVHEVQYQAISDDISHVDLMAIKKGQKMTVEVPLLFTGVSTAVRELGGVFMTNKAKVNVECLPQDIPHEIEVDISPLVDFHTSLTIADLKVSDKITILDSPEISIATVVATRAEEEVVGAPVVPDAPEVLTEKKKEGEGEAAKKEEKK